MQIFIVTYKDKHTEDIKHRKIWEDKCIQALP